MELPVAWLACFWNGFIDASIFAPPGSPGSAERGAGQPAADRPGRGGLFAQKKGLPVLVSMPVPPAAWRFLFPFQKS